MAVIIARGQGSRGQGSWEAENPSWGGGKEQSVDRGFDPQRTLHCLIRLHLQNTTSKIKLR